MYTLYEFVGGSLNGAKFNREAIESFAVGFTPDNTEKRNNGQLCARKELDKQPRVSGYIGPMWDGIRCVMKDGSVKYDFEVRDQNQVIERFGVLRYESQEAYDILSV